jgi:hypothetical protein
VTDGGTGTLAWFCGAADSFGLGDGIEDGEREISVMGFDRLIQPVALPR